MKKILAGALTALTVTCSVLGFAACGGDSSELRKTSAADPIVGSWYNELITEENITQTLYRIDYQEGNTSRYYISVCTLRYERKESTDYDTPSRISETEKKAAVYIKKNDSYDFGIGNDWVNIPDGQYEYRGPLFAPSDRDTTWFLILGDDATTFVPHTGKIPSGATASYREPGAGAGAIANSVPSSYTFKKIHVSFEEFKNQKQRRDVSGNKMWETDKETGLYADENGNPLEDQNDKSRWLPIWSWQNYTGRN